MTNLTIAGRVITAESSLPTFDDASFSLEQTIEVSHLRATADKIKIKGKNEDDVVDIIFDDGTEWIGPYGDLLEIFGDQIGSLRGTEGDVELPASVAATGQRGLGSALIKLIGVFSGKAAGTTAEKIGIAFDKKAMPQPGLFRLNEQFNLQPFPGQNASGNQYLLFIHGTASSTSGSFAKLKEDDVTGIWKEIFQRYHDRVITLEHRTVSISPIKNAIDILNQLPNNSRLDIISHSRGGIIADLLARCDRRNVPIGFLPEEIKGLKNADSDEGERLQELHKLAQQKSLEINKTIRVACPARGTTLLADRLDHFLNALLRTIGLAFGGTANQIYQLVRTFIAQVIKSRATPGHMPGLLSMIPGSPLQNVINNSSIMVKNRLVVIEGDAEFGGSVKQALSVILTNLYYRAANDFVVQTDSMRFGVRRENGVHIFLSKDNQTSHFNYFRNKNTQKAIYEALINQDTTSLAGFQHISNADLRGVFIDFVDLGEETTSNISGNRPIVLLLPGIMGSNLHVAGDKIWADFGRIGKGDIKKKLKADASGVTAGSIIGKYYSSLVNELIKTYDVSVFPFDWRLSVSGPAQNLKDLINDLSTKFNQPIKIIAHSMGGLVVRQMMINHPDDWTRYIDRDGSTFMMLGTPWLGSHLIMEVLTGHSRRVNQLAVLDIPNTKRNLMDVFANYPGVYELLPVNEEAFASPQFWNDLNQKYNNVDITIPEQRLNDFKIFKAKVTSGNNFNFKNVVYIAGKSEGTTFRSETKKSIFGTYLRYLKTPEGDGSVTWELGIPKKLPESQIYYTFTGHGDLANDAKLFPGIVEILKNGSTRFFQKTRPGTRGVQAFYSENDILISNVPADAADILFGIDPALPIRQEIPDEIEVEVTHAELKVARFPVMIGHFEHEGIVSAERALDKWLDGVLTERHRVTKYPGQIGENRIIILPDHQPKGAIVVGLGDTTKLTSFRLSKTVEYAVVEYALHMRDNCEVQNKTDFESGITSLCIGSAYGYLPMENALSAILNGVNRANVSLRNLGKELKPVRKIEFIELYEHVAWNAYFSLQNIARQEQLHLSINLKSGIDRKYGGIKKLVLGQDHLWWHHFQTELVRSEKNKSVRQLKFQSSSGMARVEIENKFTSIAVVDNLLLELSEVDKWSPVYAKTLFEILIPNDFKDIIRAQSNIIWKLDIDTAGYPWEMFHDTEIDEDPTFVKAGLIRQLATDTYRPNAQVIRNETALVIGDPIYEGTSLPQLPAAKREAEAVADKLKNKGFVVNELIGSRGTQIIHPLIGGNYKILHIAGHGMYDPQSGEVGVVIGQGMQIDAGLFDSREKVPEFVFINCCFSGVMNGVDERYYQNRYKLAANLGTQMITMGVNAVVVTGWGVDDDAAELFAATLYDQLLDGYEFGLATQVARRICFEKYPHTNTWGAYQCYGDPWYRLVRDGKSRWSEVEYIAEEQVLIDLDNLQQNTQSQQSPEPQLLINQLEHIMQRARDKNLDGGRCREKEAHIYALLDQIDLAIERYQALLSLSDATYSVKALEQYCNLRVKRLALQKKVSRAAISKLEKDLKALAFIGTTAERLNILGSASKRFAQLSTGDQRLKYLKQMAEQYEKAWLLSKGKVKSAIYPLTNWLTAHALLNGNNPIIIDGETKDPGKLLSDTEKELNKERTDHRDFWEDLNPVNLKRCELLFCDQKEIDKMTKKIIKLYQEAWKQGGTKKHAQTEIEHVEFIEAIWGRKRDAVIKEKLNGLEKVKEVLRGWV
ncbi:MAG: CHAT domain-containing protein [Saprospiraceae bacterium]|nr:CHAT domain-containing protein [Saprospiraceae bacterium]